MSRLILRGITIHNITDLDVELPLGRFIVVTGVSGSGKSSLAFDTIHNEGRLRYLETLSKGVRILANRRPRAQVRHIQGLPPTVALEQGTPSYAPRTAALDVAGLTPQLRRLFVHAGERVCPVCGHTVQGLEPSGVADWLEARLREGDSVTVSAPFSRPLDEEMRADLVEKGFTRVMVQGRRYDLELDDVPQASSFEVLLDRVKWNPSRRSRLVESVGWAYRISSGVCRVTWNGGEQIFYSHLRCPSCGHDLVKGVVTALVPSSDLGKCPACGGEGYVDGRPCERCGGTGLGEAAKSFSLNGRTFREIWDMTFSELHSFLASVPMSGRMAQALVEPALRTVSMVVDLGLGALPVGRKARALARGELQFLRLASLISHHLSGVMYVLDEPSVGMSEQEIPRLLELIGALVEQGNTVLVVEHRPSVIRAADHVLEMGPGAGEEGGRVIFQGTVKELEKAGTPTAEMLKSDAPSATGSRNASPGHKVGFVVRHRDGAHPLLPSSFAVAPASFTVLVGSMGSGKSTIISAMAQAFSSEHAAVEAVGKEFVPGGTKFVDTSLPPRASSSIVASFMGIWTEIRSAFASTPLARMRGVSASDLSLTQRGGRCEACKGRGFKVVALGPVDTMQEVCPVCEGRRYRPEILDILYRGRSISDVLEMTAREAASFFSRLTALARTLELMVEVGLGYLRLGQGLDTLSGGERQRLKLARDLKSRARDPQLYLLDEPTAGLHGHDVRHLAHVLRMLVQAGHTVVAADHTAMLVPYADDVITLPL